MVVKPRIRGFICTTAHPVGCAHHVQEQIEYVRHESAIDQGDFKNVLVLGCSGGYGLASRIVAGFGAGAKTLGVSLEKEPTDSKTASAGWYNNLAFEKQAAQKGLYAKTINADAFSDETRQQVLETIEQDLGQIDLVVYSLASPVRLHPRTGVLHRSSIKPLGDGVLDIKSVNVDKGEVMQVALDPATEAEVSDTVAVMGGEDWEFWIKDIKDAGLLASGCQTVAFTYIGSELTWPIYWEGTLGQAKMDLDRAQRAISSSLESLGGSARVAVLKAIVSQASAAIPVVPLYVALLFRVMKDQGVHEDCIAHISRLFGTQLKPGAEQRLDDSGRIRMDDQELTDEIQQEVRRRWSVVQTENLEVYGDLKGFREDFLKIFGFGFESVNYEAETDPLGSEIQTGSVLG